MSQSHKELYAFTHFRLNVSERLLLRDGKRVQLTDKTFDTLCILVRHAGDLVRKDDLMAEVWTDAVVEENNLNQKIAMLRSAFGERANSKDKYIETVRGHGFRFLPKVTIIHRDDQVPSNIVKLGLHSAENVSEQRKHDISEHEALATQLGHENEIKGNDRKEIFELDERKSAAPTGSAFVSRRTGIKQRPVLYIAAVFVVLVIGVFLLSWELNDPSMSGNAVPPSPIDSIAVLPFENATHDESFEYLSAGISQSLIDKLSKLPNLRVMSSSSVFRYKGKEQDTNTIARELHVNAVLTGSVNQIGDQTIVTVRLDDGQNSRQIWGEQYVRSSRDLLELQNDIARDASESLRALSDVDRQHLSKRYTDSSEAYSLYLKGNYKWEKHTQEDLQEAIVYYTQATEIDPNFALAYSGLAMCYGKLGNSYSLPTESFPKARSYAEKALKLDGTLAEAHGVMGAIKLFFDWDWAGAEIEINRALELNPNYAQANDLMAMYLDAMGRPDEALTRSKQALADDPVSIGINMAVGNDYYYARQYDKAIEQLEKTVALDEHFYPAYLWLGQAYEQKQMYAQAISAFSNGLSKAERHPQLLSSLAHCYAVAGDRNNALKTLDELTEMSRHQYISPYLFAIVRFALGDKEQGYASLDAAYNERSLWLIWLKVDPRLDPLRAEPRFQNLMGRVGLDPGHAASN